MSKDALPSPPLRWRQESACRDTDPQDFYPEDWEFWDEDRISDVKTRFCDQCIVKEECLDFAIGTRETEGIWGGLTHSERKSYIRRAKKEGKVMPRYDSMGSSLEFFLS